MDHNTHPNEWALGVRKLIADKKYIFDCARKKLKVLIRFDPLCFLWQALLSMKHSQLLYFEEK